MVVATLPVTKTRNVLVEISIVTDAPTNATDIKAVITEVGEPINVPELVVDVVAAINCAIIPLLDASLPTTVASAAHTPLAGNTKVTTAVCVASVVVTIPLTRGIILKVDIYALANVVTVPLDPRYFNAPDSTYS